MDGVLVIDKPPGPTSHDVVAIARRALHETRVGHTGTLDPFASGVLPLVIGRATRLAQFLTHTPKAYIATLQLGQATTTYDRTGTALAAEAWVMSPVVHGAGPWRSSREVTDADLEAALGLLAGTFLQRPPAFSAKKIGGRKAYDLARSDRPAVIEPVPVSLNSWRVVSRDRDTVVIAIECSPGFYVRSLAHDVGVSLGCGAHLAELRRTKSGPFGLSDALSLDAWAEAPGKLIPLDALLPWLASASLTPEGLTRIRHGQPARAADVVEIHGTPGAPDEPIRLLAQDGTLAGLARRRGDDGLLHPFLNLV